MRKKHWKKDHAMKPTRTKSGLSREDLREVIYRAAPALTREQAKRILDEVFEEIISALANDDDVTMRGFGRFKVQHKRPRIGRNPITQESAVISPRRVIKFVPSRNLILLVNKEMQQRTENSSLAKT